MKFLSAKTPEKPEIYMEATESYHEQLADFLVDLDVKVVNPLKIHSFSKAVSQYDKADAKLIAEYGFDEISYRKIPENIRELRALYRCSLDLKKQLVECKIHLENQNVMPESVVKVWKNLLENLKIQIKNVEKQMTDILKANDDLFNKFNALITIPGIAQNTAIVC